MIVLDSSFLIGFHNERDAHHAPARALMDRFLEGEWGPGLLLEYVFLEVVTVLLVRRGPHVASRVARVLLEADEVVFLPCSDMFTEVLGLFANQSRTRFSFADSAIAYAARGRANGFVLTFDEEFKKLPWIHVPMA